jgi:hypothetical protein
MVTVPVEVDIVHDGIDEKKEEHGNMLTVPQVHKLPAPESCHRLAHNSCAEMA